MAVGELCGSKHWQDWGNGVTPLHNAVKYGVGRPETVELLIRNGASVTAADNVGGGGVLLWVIAVDD